jgi:hypothetical protein
MNPSNSQEPIKKKHPGGRPHKTLKDLPSNWQDIIISCSLKGYSEVEIRAELIKSSGTSAKNIIGLWYALKEHEAEFLKTVNIGKILCEAWWTAEARKRLRGKNFQSFVWFKNMQNRFGWKDKLDLEHSAPEVLVEKFASLTANELIAKANGIISGKSS